MEKKKKEKGSIVNNRIRRESQMVHLETKINAAMQWWCAESSGTAVYSLGFC